MRKTKLIDLRIWRDPVDAPLLGIVGFNLFTLLVFLTAPVQWGTDHLVLLTAYVLTCQYAVVSGFQIGRGNDRRPEPVRQLPFSSGRKLMNAMFVFYLLTFFWSYAYRMHFGPFDVWGVLGQVAIGLFDPRLGYLAALDNTARGEMRWTWYFLISILDQLFFVAGFLQWRHWGRVKRFIFGILLCIEMVFWVSRGASFGIVTIATTMWLSSMLGAARVQQTRLRRWLLTAVLSGASIAFFAYNLYSRSGNAERSASAYEFVDSPIDVESPVLSVIPESLQASYMNVVSYMGQGYYHTCLAFDLDFRPTWLLGSDPALISLGQAFGFDVWDNTYVHRLASKGIDEFGAWHSAYTWFASDVSFLGVPFLLFILAYACGVAWIKARQGDFLSMVVFVVLGNLLLYLFANTSYLSSVTYAFMFLFPFWAITRLLNVGRASIVNRRPMLAKATADVTAQRVP
jgi:hypothetical protein